MFYKKEFLIITLFVTFTAINQLHNNRKVNMGKRTKGGAKKQKKASSSQLTKKKSMSGVSVVKGKHGKGQRLSSSSNSGNTDQFIMVTKNKKTMRMKPANSSNSNNKKKNGTPTDNTTTTKKRNMMNSWSKPSNKKPNSSNNTNDEEIRDFQRQQASMTERLLSQSQKQKRLNTNNNNNNIRMPQFAEPRFKVPETTDELLNDITSRKFVSSVGVDTNTNRTTARWSGEDEEEDFMNTDKYINNSWNVNIIQLQKQQKSSNPFAALEDDDDDDDENQNAPPPVKTFSFAAPRFQFNGSNNAMPTQQNLAGLQNQSAIVHANIEDDDDDL